MLARGNFICTARWKRFDAPRVARRPFVSASQHQRRAGSCGFRAGSVTSKVLARRKMAGQCGSLRVIVCDPLRAGVASLSGECRASVGASVTSPAHVASLVVVRFGGAHARWCTRGARAARAVRHSRRPWAFRVWERRGANARQMGREADMYLYRGA